MHKGSVIELVGSINDNHFHQIYLGAFVFIIKDGVLIPVVRKYDHFNNEWDNHPLTNVSLTDRIVFDVPTWGNGQGLSIMYDTMYSKQWRFTTGIHSGWQDGVSGTLAQGTVESVIELLRWHESQASK